MSDAGAPSLGQRAAFSVMRRAVAWNLVNHMVSQVGALAVFFMLTRALDPAAFGVFALAVLIVDAVAQQARSALSDALLQRRDFSAATLSTVFWGGLAAAAVCALAAAAVAGPLSRSLGVPALAAMLPALAGLILLAPAGAVVDALVLSRFDFRALAVRNVAGVAAGAVAALVLIAGPWAMWALAAQRWALILASLALTWRKANWRPTFAFAPAAALPIVRAAAPLWVGQMLSTAPSRAIDALVGARLGVEALGLLRVGGKFIEALSATVGGAFQSLWVPLFTSLERGSGAAAAVFLRAMALVALVTLPAFIGVGLVSDELARLVLGPSFSGAGAIILLASLAGLYIPLSFFRGAIFAATGRNRLAMAFGIADLAAVGLTAALVVDQGLTPLLLAVNAPALASAVIAARFAARAVGAPLRAYAAALAPAYLATAMMAAGVLALDAGLDRLHAPLIAAFVLKSVLGVGLYAGWLACFHRVWARDAIAVLRRDPTRLAERPVPPPR